MATIVHCYLEQCLKRDPENAFVLLKKSLSTKSIRAVVVAMKDGSFLKRRTKNETV